MIVYGRNSVQEALDENLVISIAYIQKGKEEKFSGLSGKLKEKGIKISWISEKALDITSRTLKHQGIAAEIVLPENIIENGNDEGPWDDYSTLLALDGITDTGNLGAIIRSALLLGAEAVVLPNDNSARITPQVIKSSAGAVYRQKVIYINSLNRFMDSLSSSGFNIIGLSGEAADSIVDVAVSGKTCLVIGSEHEGIRKSVKKKCGLLARIPTTRKLDSLNASAASSIALWEIYRRKSIK